LASGATDDQALLIACCWILPAGRRLFRAFPEVLGVDGTHQTNEEHRPLITIKDSDGNVIVVIRCFAPNERAWFFRWLFQEALPALIGKETMACVKVIITDGDSQEMSQVDFAINTALWSDSITVNHLTLHAESRVQFAIGEIENYASLRTSKVDWLVVRSIERNTKRSSTFGISMSQVSHIPQDPYDEWIEDHDDIELGPASNSCIDFEERFNHTYAELRKSSIVNESKPYQVCMPKCKELFALMASNAQDEDEETEILSAFFDEKIARQKTILFSRKPAPKGRVISACPVGKHARKTNVAEWSHPQLI
jgi:hypothetical protein